MALARAEDWAAAQGAPAKTRQASGGAAAEARHPAPPRLSERVRRRLRLSFDDPALEARFRAQSFAQSIGTVRLSILLGALLFAGFGALDHVLYRNQVAAIWVIRYGIVVPLLLLLLAYTYAPSFQRFAQVATSAGVLTAGAGVLAMIAILDGTQHYYYVGLIIIIFYACHFLRLRFAYAGIASWVLVLGYQAVVLLEADLDRELYISNNFFLVTAALVGTISGFVNEHYIRQTFLGHALYSERERQLDVVASNIPGAVFRHTGVGGRRAYPFISEGLRHVFGISPDEVMRSPDTFRAFIHPEDRRELYRIERRSARLLLPIEHDTRLLYPDGTVKWARILARPNEDAQGRLVWDGVMLDITDLKAREAELRQAQKMDALGQLTSGLAHDFGKLLSIIGLNLDVIDRDGFGTLRQHRARRRAGQAIAHGERLIARLMDVARRRPLRAETVDIALHVRGMIEMLSATLGDEITVRTEIGSDLPSVQVDPDGLSNLLLNLALNARDAMPAGGTLTISVQGPPPATARRPERRLGMGDDRRMVLTVSDTGRGMSGHELEHAFEPFFTTKEPENGSGLGLSAVYGFVQQSGGGIVIESQPGRGTDVRIWLPARRESRSALRTQA